jgi:NADH dehydrogenase FAD-containing subunit
MVLLGSTGFVDNALRTVGADEVIPFADTMEDALRLARQSRS